VFYDRDILERPFRVSVRSDGATNNWTQAENIERSDPDARAYEVRTYSNRFEVIFGDDLNGLVPPNGSDITITYRVGGGSKGNIGAGAIDVSRTVSPEAPYNASVPIRFRNLSASTGGVNRETIEDAKKRAPRLFSTRGSAITEKDYAYLSIGFAHPAFGTIAKAMATVRTGLNANRVEVYALAEGTDGIPTLPSDGLKLALRNYLDEVNVITDEVVVKNGSIRAINLTLAIIMNRSADPTAVRLKAESEIKSYFNIRNWDMGEPFYISSLYEILNKIDGVSYIDILSPTDNILALNTTTELDPNSVGVHIDEVVTLGSVDSKYYYEAVR
jgi:predicted phage baseplate assembly protein